MDTLSHADAYLALRSELDHDSPEWREVVASYALRREDARPIEPLVVFG